MNIIQALFGDANRIRAQNAQLHSLAMGQVPRRQYYQLMQAYYYNNNLYEDLQKQWINAGQPAQAIKGLRNPAFRCVEFYPANVWPGPLDKKSTLEVVTQDPPNNKALIEQIQLTFERSDWDSYKEVFVRELAEYGDSLIKIAHNDKREAILQVINPLDITWIVKGVANKLTKLRLDTLQIDDSLEQDATLMANEVPCITEVWDLARDSLSIWEHKKGQNVLLKDLGSPNRTISISGEMRIDFLPFVHSRFMNVNDTYGTNAFVLSIEKIDELNRAVTRLHQILYRYNRPFMAISSNSVDKDGRPIPAPNIGRTSTGGRQVVDVEDNEFMTLPGAAKLDATVPNINWDGHMNAIDRMMEDIQADLPELNYYDLNDNSGANARAAFFRMSPAIQRLVHIRGVCESALVRANRIALYINGQFGVKGAIKYESPQDPKSKHSFKDRPYLQLSQIDQEEANLAKVNVLVAKKNIGVDDRTLLIEAGYEESEVEEMMKRKKEDLLAMQETFANANGVMPSRQQQNGQSPTFNENGNNANNKNEQGATKQNGQPRQARGVEG